MRSGHMLCLALCLALACAAPAAGDGAGEGSATATGTGSATATATATATDPTTTSTTPEPWSTPFAVRGRWANPRGITWTAERTGVPQADAAFDASIERAAAVWNVTGVVALDRARDGEVADVAFGWRRGAHDDCPAFGRSPSVAHSGWHAAGGFVHFDADRAWNLRGDAASPSGDRQAEALVQVAAHEWGHVLGLDHVADPVALMSPDARVAIPGAGDLAGLHSLYGGGVDGPGDVRLVSDDVACVLRRVAPADHTLCGLFDTDGDGSWELLIVRMDPAGFGALMIYRFGVGPVLMATEGPFPGIATPGMQTMFAVDPAGARWIVTRDEDGIVVRLRRFDESGRLVEPSPHEVMALDVEALADGWVTRGDVDGDGVLERLVRVE